MEASKQQQIEDIFKSLDIAYSVVGSNIMLKMDGVIRVNELMSEPTPDSNLMDALLELAATNKMCKNILVTSGYLAPDPPPMATIGDHEAEEDFAASEEEEQSAPTPPPEFEREKIEW